MADGYHARADGFTSLAVLFGALGVLAGFPIADPIVGLLITVAILFVLRQAAREIWHRLMDAVDPELVDGLESAAHLYGVEDCWRATEHMLDMHIRSSAVLPSSP